MNKQSDEAVTVLTKVDELVDEFFGEEEETSATEMPSCIPKALPGRLLVQSAEVAYRLNPVNAPVFAAFGATVPARDIMEPQKIAVLTSKYWGPKQRRLSVSFMESIPTDLRKRILSHMNAWNVGITFVWTTGTGRVRISREPDGYWSYLGTDVLLIPRSRQTMNLEGFTMNTSEREFRRVIRHETGHTLGCPHEHMRQELVDRIDPEKAYAYFWRTQGWDRDTVDVQVLTPLEERSLMATPIDQTSIMCYQLPSSITRDGEPILGGMDINESDSVFMRRLYPKPVADAAPKKSGKAEAAEIEEAMSSAEPTPMFDEWDESEDVEVDFNELDD